MERRIIDVQQDICENSGFRNEVIWDLLSADQENILKKKLIELIPDQDNGQNCVENLRETLFTNIWAQRKYTNKNSLTAIIYVLVTSETNFNKVKDSTSFSCHLVFRARKCVATDDSSECCMIYIDEVGRVYQNWDAFIKNNVLPASTMVAPHRGVYTFDENNKVKLDMYPTPAASTFQRFWSVVDTSSSVAGLLSACVPIAALLTVPIAAPVVAVATGVGLATAGYSTIRSGANLVDRSQHDQAIGLGDRQARWSWLGLVSGAVGVGASGASQVMRTAAKAGREISWAGELAVNGINIMSIASSGTGVAHGVFDLILKYKNGESVTTLDVLQLSASLVLFTHSVTNFRLASQLINEAQNNKIETYRKNLSTRQRRMFDKMSKETLRIRGVSRGKLDIIRSVNDIPSKQYLNDLFKVNKKLNDNNIRPAFSGNGEQVVLNNEVYIDTKTLRNNVQHNIGSSILDQVTQPIPASVETVPSKSRPGAHNARILRTDRDLTPNKLTYATILSSGVRALCSGVIVINNIEIPLREFSVRIFENIINAESFETVVTTMAELFGMKSFVLFMNLTETFIANYLADIHKVLRTFISSEAILYRILVFCCENYRNKSYPFLNAACQEILETVKNYFLGLNPHNYPDLLKKCKHCVGFYAITDL